MKGCGAQSSQPLRLPAPTMGLKGDRARQPWAGHAWGEQGSEERSPGSPAPADTHQFSEGASLPSSAVSEEEQAVADTPRRQHWKRLLAPDRARAGAGAPSCWLTGKPIPL